MALVLADRVQETTNTTGTGTLTLAGAVLGFQSFAAIGDGNTTYYVISSGANWEVGLGTYTSAGATLSRDTVFSSSAGGTTKISVVAGATVIATFPASVATPQDVTGYTTTATAGGTTTLTATSTFQQFFTGSTTQTVQLPVTSTLSLGWNYWITNNATGNLTVNSSGGDLVYTVLPQTTAMFTVVNIALTTAAAWSAGVTKWTASTGTGSVVMANSPTLTAPVLAAGTSVAGTAPLKLTSGTNLTTAEAGATEYDGTVPFFTPFGTSRGVLSAEQLVILGSTYTLSGTTAAQKLFNATANGAVTVAVGTYEFECCFALSTLAAASSSFAFGFGGGATFTFSFLAIASKQTSLTTPVVSTLTTVYSTTQNTISVANTNTTGIATIRGVVRVTAGGTLVPQVAMSLAANAIVQAGSYFRIYPVSSSGSGSITVGNWS